MKAIDICDLTPSQLNEIVSKAFKEASEETMRVMGYNTIAEDGWVVKVYADGRKEKIKQFKF
jgi:hypothetical protein